MASMLGRRVEFDRAATVGTPDVPLLIDDLLRSHQLLEQNSAPLRIPAVGPDAVEPLEGELRRDVSVIWDERSVRTHINGKFVLDPFGIDEEQARVVARDADVSV